NLGIPSVATLEKELASYVTPETILSESVDRLRELFQLQSDVATPTLAKVRRPTAHDPRPAAPLPSIKASGAYVEVMRREAQSELESLHFLATTLEPVGR